MIYGVCSASGINCFLNVSRAKDIFYF